MKSITLEPTVHECIETVAKKKYWSLVGEYSRSRGIDEAMESAIELLRKFLEEADIAMLRAATEARLNKNEIPQVMIRLDRKGRLKVRVR